MAVNGPMGKFRGQQNSIKLGAKEWGVEMLKRIVIFLIFIVVAFAGFLHFAKVGTAHSADLTIRYFGPGDRPSVCAVRARDYFDRNEPVMREISAALMDARRYDEVRVNLDPNWKYWLFDEANDIEPDQDDFEVFFPKFEKLEKGNFFTPSAFRKIEDYVGVRSNGATCGPKTFDWLKFRIGANYYHGYPYGFVGFVYAPNGDYELNSCNEPVKGTDTPISCDIRLTDDWVMNTFWVSFPDDPVERIE